MCMGHALFSGFDLNLRNTVSRSSAVAEAASIADERAEAYGRTMGEGSGTVMANDAQSLTTTLQVSKYTPSRGPQMCICQSGVALTSQVGTLLQPQNVCRHVSCHCHQLDQRRVAFDGRTPHRPACERAGACAAGAARCRSCARSAIQVSETCNTASEVASVPLCMFVHSWVDALHA
jgi:hypothetical protein